MQNSRPFASAPESSAGALSSITPDERAQAEERYQLALESVNYAFYDWDIETGVVHTSPALAIMLGVPLESLAVPANWADWIHPEDRPVYRRALVAHLKEET